jgi:hypothetical protein
VMFKHAVEIYKEDHPGDQVPSRTLLL